MASFAMAVETGVTPAGVAGQYVPLRVNADAAGVVEIRGDAVQGVDWPANGAGSAVVPLLVYGRPAEGVTLTRDAAPLPFDLPADVSLAAEATFDDDVYQRAALWKPGLTAAARRWTLSALGVVVLVLGVAAYADPKRATRWTVLAAAGLCVGTVVYFPADKPSRHVPIAGTDRWEWVWRVGRAGETVEEPWAHGLRFVPRSAAHLKDAGPVLRCDAVGQPVAVSCRLDATGRAVFVRRVMFSESE